MAFIESKDEQIIAVGFPCSKTLDELMDEGLSFREANAEMKTRWYPLVSPDGTKRFEFVEGEVESGKKVFNEGLTEYKRRKR